MRDTDHDWNAIAEFHPYYQVLSHDRFLDPTQDDLVDFFASGEHDILHTRNIVEQHLGSFNPKTALDFGCGVGRLTIALAKLAGQATGVDISEGMLALARQHILEFGVDVDLAREIPIGRQYDWVHTAIVLQHIPPARGYGLIRDLWEAVAPGGAFTFQLTVFRDSRHPFEVQRDLGAFRYDGEAVIRYSTDNGSDGASMSMYDYDLSRVFYVLALGDGHPVYLEKTDHGGCHGFRIYVRKP